MASTQGAGGLHQIEGRLSIYCDTGVQERERITSVRKNINKPSGIKSSPQIKQNKMLNNVRFIYQ
jgi:hypothetical protein